MVTYGPQFKAFLPIDPWSVLYMSPSPDDDDDRTEFEQEIHNALQDMGLDDLLCKTTIFHHPKNFDQFTITSDNEDAMNDIMKHLTEDPWEKDWELVKKTSRKLAIMHKCIIVAWGWIADIGKRMEMANFDGRET